MHPASTGFCRRRHIFGAAALAAAMALGTTAACARVQHAVPRTTAPVSEAEWGAMKARAVPAWRHPDRLPARLAEPAFAAVAPSILPRDHGSAEGDAPAAGELPAAFPGPDGAADAAPENHGDGNAGTIYHCNDYLQQPDPVRHYPFRAAGKIWFRGADGIDGRCSGVPIAPSIIVTAGHCVHQGGNRDAGWNRRTLFVPAANGSTEPCGRREASYLGITRRWFNRGQIADDYDVGIIVCGNRLGTRREIGRAAGWFGHCYANCLQPYWFLTQPSYPQNVCNGDRMTASQHLSEGLTFRDYFHGTGMRGGSSGGPHVSNIGEFQDSSTSPGQFTPRNILFAVTSRGWVAHGFTQQGASTLAGAADANNWVRMHSQVCRAARRAHGRRSCSLLDG